MENQLSQNEAKSFTKASRPSTFLNKKVKSPNEMVGLGATFSACWN